jgi:LmbE family N-acetylglucosaminyl deacetylase
VASEAVAIIVAHPDDEVLLAGGTIARHAANDDHVCILFLATGAAARGGDQAAYVARLRGQADRASKILGAKSVSFGDFPDNRMDSVALLDVVREVETFLGAARSEVIYTHHSGDLNVDHRVVHQAVLTACRPLPGRPVRRIYAGEALSSTEWAPSGQPFRPTTYVDITRVLDKKLAALGCYEGELRDFPHPRSAGAMRALAALRGAECGLEAAEAFILLREVCA